MSVDISESNEKIREESSFIALLKSEMAKVIVGQDKMVRPVIDRSFIKWAYSTGRSSRSGKDTCYFNPFKCC